MTDKQNGWHYVVARFCYPRYKKYLGGNMEIVGIVLVILVFGFILGFIIDKLSRIE